MILARKSHAPHREVAKVRAAEQRPAFRTTSSRGRAACLRREGYYERNIGGAIQRRCAIRDSKYRVVWKTDAPIPDAASILAPLKMAPTRSEDRRGPPRGGARRTVRGLFRTKGSIIVTNAQRQMQEATTARDIIRIACLRNCRWHLLTYYVLQTDRGQRLHITMRSAHLTLGQDRRAEFRPITPKSKEREALENATPLMVGVRSAVRISL